VPTLFRFEEKLRTPGGEEGRKNKFKYPSLVRKGEPGERITVRRRGEKGSGPPSPIKKKGEGGGEKGKTNTGKKIAKNKVLADTPSKKKKLQERKKRRLGKSLQHLQGWGKCGVSFLTI